MKNLLVLILNLLDIIFFMSYNNILSHSVISYNCNCMNRMFLPTLTYSVAATKLSETQIDSLNACWNSVYRRSFHFNRWESVKCVIRGLDRLDFRHLRLQLSTQLYLSM